MTTSTRILKKVKRRIRKPLLSPSGGSATYVQISSTKGIKVFKAEYTSFEEALTHDRYKYAQTEVLMARKAKKVYPYVPDVYEVKILRINNHYRIGIVLQHVGDTRLSDKFSLHFYRYSDQENNKRQEKLSEVIKKHDSVLRKNGIYHGDLHSDNIMFFKGHYWIIDFGMAYIKTNEICTS